MLTEGLDSARREVPQLMQVSHLKRDNLRVLASKHWSLHKTLKSLANAENSAGAAAKHSAADSPDAGGGASQVLAHPAAAADQAAAADGAAAAGPARAHPEHADPDQRGQGGRDRHREGQAQERDPVQQRRQHQGEPEQQQQLPLATSGQDKRKQVNISLRNQHTS